MPMRDLVEAWAALVLLGIGTVLIAAATGAGQGKSLAAVGVLGLAGLKARLILSRYLGLAASRFWMHAFDLVIVVFLTLGFAVYMFGSGRAG